MPTPSASGPIGFDKSDEMVGDKSSMNQILSPTNPLFLPLVQLNPHCSRLLESVNGGKASKKELIISEQNLWREVKKLKALQDNANIFTYLIGYYHTILYQLARFNNSEDIFRYHILIRLGDLNRYLDRWDIAEYYYCNARNLFPDYGHAYNQLGILTRKENFYKCCYYYARAAKSIKKPLDKSLAESNLRLVIVDHENTILNHISNDDPSISGIKSNSNTAVTEDGPSSLSMPVSAFEWFYVIVVAIYYDNMLPVAKPFMNYMSTNFSTQRATVLRDGLRVTTINCDRDSYLLMACLDILLDWTRLSKQGKAICQKIGGELRQMRTSLGSLLSALESSQSHKAPDKSDSPKTFSPPQPNSLAMDARAFTGPGYSTPLSPSSERLSDESLVLSANDSHGSAKKIKLPALPHDCVLKGFKPLESTHERLSFPKELPVFDGANGKLDEFGGKHIMECNFIGPQQLIQILNRISYKIDAFGPLVKRRIRNIALESILSSMSSCNSDL